MEEKISVIIPVYNVEKYVRKSIKSMINQTYQNLEILIVDDGSTDGCPSICDEFADNDSRIRVIHQPNKGQGAARNRALDIATGEYICYMDSDDSVKPDYIEFLYRQLKENNLDISVCNYELYDESGNLIRKRITGDGYQELTGIQAIKSMWTQGIINIGPWVKLYKRELWNDIRFKECFSEDFATMHYIFEKAKKVGYSYECKLEYLVRSNSSIRAFQNKKLVMIDIAEENICFAKRYPELIPAAKQKAASVYFHVLFQLPHQKEYDYERKRIERLIKDIRLAVLLDKSCIKKTRVALLLSFGGFNLTERLFYKIKKGNKAF